MDFRKTKNVLNLIWYSTLPGVFILGTAVIYFVMFGGDNTGAVNAELANDQLARLIPWILAAAAVGGFGLALFFKQNFLQKRAIAMAGKANPDQHLKALVMIQLGVSDAPCIIGLVFYAITGWEWIAAGIIVYAFLASALFKPDFEKLYALLASTRTF